MYLEIIIKSDSFPVISEKSFYSCEFSLYISAGVLKILNRHRYNIITQKIIVTFCFTFVLLDLLHIFV